MSASIVTYFSKNSDPDQAWMAFIETKRGRIGVHFTANTEEAVKEKVRRFWRSEKERKSRTTAMSTQLETAQ